MIIPYATDAPIYHRPVGTVTLIVVNALVFFATVGMAVDDRMAYALVRGDGLHPVQWLTSCFMHADVMHLVGNMIFLWAFGIVVEGKLGAWKFVPLYLFLGVAHGALMQVLSLRAEHGYVLGASAAIYGLMAVCAVWAPVSNLTCFYLFWIVRIYTGTSDVAILMFAIFYIGWEFVVVLFTHAAMSTPFLHLSGALIGLAVGVFMLQAKLVDCENWDLFAVMSGREGPYAKKKKRRGTKPRPRVEAAADHGAVPEERTAAGFYDAPAPAPAPAAAPRRRVGGRDAGGDPSETAAQRLRRHLDLSEPLAAHAAYDRAMRTVPGWTPDERDWTRLIKLLLDAKETRTAVTVMEDYLRRVELPSPRVRLKLAQVLLRDFERPSHALRVLADLAGEKLPPDLEAYRAQLAAEAQHQCDEGVLELDGEAW